MAYTQLRTDARKLRLTYINGEKEVGQDKKTPYYEVEKLNLSRNINSQSTGQTQSPRLKSIENNRIKSN